MIVSREFKDTSKKYIIFNPEFCRQWLLYLFANHPEYVRVSVNHQVEFSEVRARTSWRKSSMITITPANWTQTVIALSKLRQESVLTKTEVHTFDKYPNLYLSEKQVLKINQEGLIEIIKDTSVRRPCYNVSANMCFSHLYPNEEMPTLVFSDYKLAKQLLKICSFEWFLYSTSAQYGY